jgi:hypothetical protein
MSGADRLRLGYAPCSASCAAPGDRRRFAGWAGRRGVAFELARPDAEYDVVVLSALADISHWSRLPRTSTTRVVYDLVDSYLTVPAWTPADVARGLGKTLLRQHRRATPSYHRAVAQMCSRADVVICSTEEQRATILQYCPDVRVVLDMHEQEFLPRPRTQPPAPGELRLFWEGQPQNLDGFAPALEGALRDLQRELRVSVHVATDSTYGRWFNRVGTAHTARVLERLPVPWQLHEWATTDLPELAARCDVGVIPLDLHNAFAVGKPENKLLIMWRLGLPVVTSTTPAYDRTMRAAGLQSTCRTREDWVAALRALAQPAARAAAAEAGQRYLEAQHTDERLLAQWDRLLEDVLRRPARP